MFFDIGANKGDWALANVQNSEKIIAVEASPITFQKLRETCKDDKILLLNYAVCDNNGEDIVFYHADSDTLSTLNKDWLTSESSRFSNTGFQEIVCKTISMDELIARYGVPDLIKVDVEGGEYQCLRSLTQKVNLLCFEWASEMNSITFQCLDYLISIGFTQFSIQLTDEYLYRPSESEFLHVNTIKTILRENTIPKHHWGMIWCK